MMIIFTIILAHLTLELDIIMLLRLKIIQDQVGLETETQRKVKVDLQRLVHPTNLMTVAQISVNLHLCLP